MGRRDMHLVFQWLKRQNVKSVLKLTVIDNAEPSHSDESIEACVDGLDIRIWNWYKIDLCCSVVSKSAPRVNNLALHSSGNNAVLVGWSSRVGLATLKEVR